VAHAQSPSCGPFILLLPTRIRCADPVHSCPGKTVLDELEMGRELVAVADEHLDEKRIIDRVVHDVEFPGQLVQYGVDVA